MRQRRVALSVLAAAAVLGPAHASIADPPAKPRASASARVAIPPWPDPAALPAFDAEAWPDEPSKPPKASEWKDAPEVRLSSAAPIAAGCRSYRVREWVKIHCERRTAALRLIAGSAEGVAMFTFNGVGEPNGAEGAQTFWETMGKFGEIIVPVRKGDRRVFEWVDFDFGEYEGWWVQSSFVVEESWVEGAKLPELALRAR
ncbi:MAG TPA: hypothetical protein VHB21_13540 [Minicystis sp.]|nr:hypothetical protein [Minicystis sp.]